MKHPFRRAAQGILCATVLALVVSLFCSSAMLTITHQTVPAPVDAGLRIAHLTDLHNACFGKDNARLVQAVREQQPDLIFCTGDLFNKNDPDTTRAGALVKQLAAIAPVYCSLGNHEVEWGKNFGADPAEVYRQAGAIVVEREFFDVTVQGSDLRIGGLYGYACPQGGERGKEWSAHAWYAEECAFLRTFCDTPRTKLLLCHMPVAWLEYGSLDS